MEIERDSLHLFEFLSTWVFFFSIQPIKLGSGKKDDIKSAGIFGYLFQ